MSKNMSESTHEAPQPKFAEDTRVRVKAGVRHKDYPDLPMGGWAGRTEDHEHDEEGFFYLVRLSDQTLKARHPIYAQRCLRDDFDDDLLWLHEDELEPDDGTPAPIEEPVLPPFLQQAGEKQLVRIFDLSENDYYPEVDADSLQVFYKFLQEHLEVPFEGTYYGDADEQEEATIVRLRDPRGFPEDVEDGRGLFCTVICGGEEQVVPLRDIAADEEHLNCELIADYDFWLDMISPGDWDEEEDEAENEDSEDDDEDFDEDLPEFRSPWNEAKLSLLNEPALGNELSVEARELLEELADEDEERDQDLEPDPPPAPIRSGPKVGRNDPCPCGSSKKYKKCCLKSQSGEATDQ